MVDDPLLTAEEAGRELRVSAATVSRERAAGKLAFVKVRGRYFYRLAQVRAYILAQSVPCRQNTSSPSDPAPPVGTLPGPKDAVAAAFQQARKIVSKLNSSSRRSA